MKKRRKSSQCLNCGTRLKESHNFCPNCGQENNNNQLSFGILVSEFFSNYFSLDSKFGRTVQPFLFSPGKLTRLFMEGKRASFANPVRWYLVVSLIHFFLLSKLVNSRDDGSRGQIISTSQSAQGNLTLTTSEDTLALFETPTMEEKESNESSMRVSDDIIDEEELALINDLIEKNYSRKEIEDSLKVEERNFWERLLTKQTIALQSSSQASLNAFIVKNIPILMFILLPIYALLLKAFFYRRLYINHLIHSIHLHSFILLFLSFIWIVLLAFYEDLPKWIGMVSFFILTLYVITSFRRTYEIRWFTAIWKVFFSGFIYFCMLVVGLLFVTIASALLF